MKQRLILLLLLFGLLSVKAQTIMPVDADASLRLSLNGTWNFQLDGSGKSGSIKVPGNWNMQGFAEPVYGKNREPMYTSEHPSHNGTYQRKFTIPANWKGKQVWIAFDGVENGYRLYVNGDSIGAFHSAFNRSMFDISHAVKFGKENEITVKVTQTDMPYWEFDTNDDWGFGGISRDVTLFAIPQNHITDLTLAYSLRGNDADVKLKMAANTAKHAWQVELIDAKGQTVSKSSIFKSDSFTIPVANANLWSAESPYLYTLRLSLLKGKKVEQTVEKKIGIRTISWDNAVFKVNGVAVKFKGINHHDESPVNGRAMTEEEMLKDLRMMKAANINAFRCSHYPPSPHLMDMLDSLGFYTICEVPYGFGDKHLDNPSTLPELLKRAWYTVQRDKNRPSVVIWSVGNENPITSNGLTTAHYVLRLDPTRPNLFPNTHEPFFEELKLKDDSITMYSVHYPTASELKGLTAKLKHPLLNTECAHALGLDYGQIEELMDVWYTDDKLTGGCVWDWADQGIIRKATASAANGGKTRLNSRYKTTEEVWLSPDTYYDMMSIQGTDGIVYPNRFPQTDYWQTKAVFSPVVIKKDVSGRYTITNRYDFTNLSALKYNIELFANASEKWLKGISASGGNKIISGSVDVKPRDTKAFSAMNTLSDGNYDYAVVTFSNNKGEEVYRQSFQLRDINPNFDNIYNTATPILTSDSIAKLLKNNVRLRLGRKSTLSSEATINRQAGKLHHLWSKYLLEPSSIRLQKSQKNKKEATFVYAVRYDCDSSHYADGTITVKQPSGKATQISYQIQLHGSGEALEAGLTLLTPMNCGNAIMRYLGNGPYACYPAKSLLSWFGNHSISGDDIYFPGNRMNVKAATLYDKAGKGLAIITHEGDNVCVERNADGTINLSQSVKVASPFNKGFWPEGSIQTDGLSFSGSFDIYCSDKLTTPNFGEVKIQRPFYNSYDQ